MRTHKETAVFVLEGLISQGGLSFELNNSVYNPVICKYRSIVDGTKRCCAAGLLIPDDKYTDEFECKGVRLLKEEGLFEFENDDDDILVKLQLFHDSLARSILNHLDYLNCTLNRIKSIDVDNEVKPLLSHLVKELEFCKKDCDDDE